MIVCAVLAAGGSTRLGRPKQLLPFRAEPLVVHALRAASFLPTAVVLGAHRDAIEPVLPPDVERLVNDRWPDGMASSLRVATTWARSVGATALLVHLVDQPLVDRAHLEALALAFRAGAVLVGSSYDGVIGAPAVFSAALFSELEALAGDRGAAVVLRSHAETRAIPAPASAIDVDTPADVQRLESASSANAMRR